MTPPIKILFISHEATASGAVLILLSIQRWMKAHTDLYFETILAKRGQLDNEIASLGKIWAFKHASIIKKIKTRFGEKSIIGSFLLKLINILPDSPKRTLRKLSKIGFDLIYSNTLVNGETIRYLSTLNIPIITHSHELLTILSLYGEDDYLPTIDKSAYFIAASDHCKDVLENQLKIAAKKISVVNTFFDKKRISCSNFDNEFFLQKHQIPIDAHLVGVCGYSSLIKGTDLIPILAKKLPKYISGKSVHFVHIGDISAYELALYKRDLIKLGAQVNVSFLGRKNSCLEFIRCFDINVVTSREEALSLVMLEAAYFGVPTICFQGSAGPSAFCNGKSGIAVPYLDIEAMSNEIVRLLTNDRLRVKIGSEAKKLLESNYSIDNNMQRLVSILNQLNLRSSINLLDKQTNQFNINP